MFALYSTDELGNPRHVSDHATLSTAIAAGRTFHATLSEMGYADLDVWVLDDEAEPVWNADDVR